MTTARRTPRSDGARSRQTILEAAARLATIEGLDGLSIGRLAEHTGMSKSGLFGLFGSKEELQLATIETATELFNADVIDPTTGIEDPLERLEALCASFIDYLRRKVFPGGCFFAAVVAEFDAHPGPVKDRVAQSQAAWMALLESLVVEGQLQGRVDTSESPEQLVFELDAMLLMANFMFVLHDDVSALDRAMIAVKNRLDRVRLA